MRTKIKHGSGLSDKEKVLIGFSTPTMETLTVMLQREFTNSLASFWSQKTTNTL